MSVEAAHIPMFVAVAPADYTIVGGAQAWIDTDITASIGTLSVPVLFTNFFGGAQLAGVRSPGSSVTAYNSGANGTRQSFIGQSVAGHVELFRDAANNVYHIMGYFT